MGERRRRAERGTLRLVPPPEPAPAGEPVPDAAGKIDGIAIADWLARPILTPIDLYPELIRGVPDVLLGYWGLPDKAGGVTPAEHGNQAQVEGSQQPGI